MTGETRSCNAVRNELHSPVVDCVCVNALLQLPQYNVHRSFHTMWRSLAANRNADRSEIGPRTTTYVQHEGSARWFNALPADAEYMASAPPASRRRKPCLWTTCALRVGAVLPGQRAFLASVDWATKPQMWIIRVKTGFRVLVKYLAERTQVRSARLPAFDKGWSPSVIFRHLIRFGDSLDETHISTKRAPTQQKARVPRQDANQGGSRHYQAPPPKGPEANRRLRRCTSPCGLPPSFKRCFDSEPAAAVAGCWSFRRPGLPDPRGSGLWSGVR